MSSPYQKLYKRPLSPEEVAEIKFNLIGYFKTLIEMDRQYQAWQKSKSTSKLTTNDNK